MGLVARRVLALTAGFAAAAVWVLAWGAGAESVYVTGLGLGLAVAWAVAEGPTLSASWSDARHASLTDLIAPIDTDRVPQVPLRYRATTERLALLTILTAGALATAMIGLATWDWALCVAGVVLGGVCGWFACCDLVTLRARRRAARTGSG